MELDQKLLVKLIVKLKWTSNISFWIITLCEWRNVFLKHTMLKYLGVNVMTSRANSQVVQEKLLQRDGDKKKKKAQNVAKY